MATKQPETTDAGAVPAAAPSDAEAANGNGGLRLLSRDDILGMDDVRYAIINVRAWKNQAVRIKSLTAREREEFEQSISKTLPDGTSKTDLITARAKLCVRIMVDANGRRIFDDSFVGALSNKNAEAIGQIFDDGAKLSGITKRDVEELAGNSPEVRTDS